MTRATIRSRKSQARDEHGHENISNTATMRTENRVESATGMIPGPPQNINEKKGVVYIMLNCKTKKMIVGSTSRTAIHRFQQHLRVRSDTISKKAAR